MIKVITIDGKEIKLKSTGATARLYRQFFHKDFFSELMKIKDLDEDVNLELLENIVWVLAKTADDSIPDINEWLDQFSSPFSIYKELNSIVSLLTNGMESIVKPKKNKKKKKKN